MLGLVRAEALGVDPATPIEEVMPSGPVTFRPNLGAGQMPDYLKKACRGDGFPLGDDLRSLPPEHAYFLGYPGLAPFVAAFISAAALQRRGPSRAARER